MAEVFIYPATSLILSDLVHGLVISLWEPLFRSGNVSRQQVLILRPFR